MMTVVCVRCARLLSADVRAGKVKSSDICEATISQRLAANRGMSDPSLLLRIGLAQRYQSFFDHLSFWRRKIHS
jgi:undecaprenyl pyrophosphate synthase